MTLSNKRNEMMQRMRQNQREGSIKIYQEMARLAQERAEEAMKILIRIGETFAFERFEQLKQGGSDLIKMKPERLMQIINQELQSMKIVAEGSQILPERLEELSQEHDEAIQELSETKKALDTTLDKGRNLESRNKALMDQVTDLVKENRSQKEVIAQLGSSGGDTEEDPPVRKTSAKTRKRATPKSRRKKAEKTKQESKKAESAKAITEDEFKEWLREWKKARYYQREASLIGLLGETGKCKSSELTTIYAKKFKSTSATFYRAVDGAQEVGLVLMREEQFSTGGRPAKIVMLTSKGKMVYRVISGDEPKESEFHALMRAHKSPQHISLIKIAGEHLERLGYEVDLNPNRIRANEPGSYFYPDIKAVYPDGGEVLYFEVQRSGSRPSKISTESKWKNAIEVGVGNVWVITESQRAANRFVNDVIYLAGEMTTAVTIHVATTDKLKKAESKDEIWYKVKGYNPRE